MELTDQISSSISYCRNVHSHLDISVKMARVVIRLRPYRTYIIIIIIIIIMSIIPSNANYSLDNKANI